MLVNIIGTLNQHLIKEGFHQHFFKLLFYFPSDAVDRVTIRHLLDSQRDIRLSCSAIR
jgi:hypothetical protein